jgi:dTDP-4-amino-4,6-dideoxygalactose transaminase
MMVTNDPELEELLWSYRNVGRRKGGAWYEHVRLGWNLRITEFQAAVLLEQMRRFPAQQAHRAQSAAYLTSRLAQIPGVAPLRVPDGVTTHTWYSYHLRWLGEEDGGLPKLAFSEALRAEGIPNFHGYVPLNRNAAVRDEIARLGGPAPAACPAAERAADHEVIMLALPVLMSDRHGLDQVVEAVAKVATARP